MKFKTLALSTCSAVLASSQAFSAIPDVTFEVSADVANLCTLQARSAHLGTMLKDVDATTQFATAANVLVKCGAGLEVDLSGLADGTLPDAAELAQLADVAAITSLVGSLGGNYELTFTNDDGANAGFQFTGTGSDLPFDLHVVNGPGVGALAPDADAPQGFSDGNCDAPGDGNTYVAVTSGTAVPISSLPITITNSDVGVAGMTQSIPTTIAAGSNLIRFCYEVTQANIDAADISDNIDQTQYYNEFGAGGGAGSTAATDDDSGADADTEYNEVITVSITL